MVIRTEQELNVGHVSTRGRLFVALFLAVSVMYQVVSSVATKASGSFWMSRWENMVIFGVQLVESF